MNKEEFVCEICGGIFSIEFTNWVNVKKYDEEPVFCCSMYVIRTCDSCNVLTKYDSTDNLTGTLLDLDNE